MQNNKDEPTVTLRSNRTSRSGNENRESFFSDSTSGIDKGEDEESSSESDTFSGTDLIEESNKDNSNQSQQEKHEIEPNEDTKLLKDVTDNTEIENNKSTIPDGGWGWMVVLSSFIISMIADGISFSFGLLYIEFLEEFQASKSTTAWIGSLFIAVPLLSGPVMSALVDRYGCRSMTILGGIISTIGFVLASISTSLEMMMITFGVIAGLGLGLVYVTAVVSIAFWFEKKRNLAVGLGACGTGVGTFVYAPMTQYFIDEYGWRGAILLLSGTLLNLCVCGCVMKDPDWWTDQENKPKIKEDENLKKLNEKLRSKSTDTASIAEYEEDVVSTRGKNMKGLIDSGVSPEKVISLQVACIRRRENFVKFTSKFDQIKNKADSNINLPTFLTYNDKVSREMLDGIIETTSKNYEIEVKYPLFITSPVSVEKKDLPSNDPPVVTYPKCILKRSHSERYDIRKEKTLGDYQLKNPKTGRVLVKSKSEEAKNNLVKQDSKGERREWLKKQFSVNHHYLKDLKMPANSIGHRNALLNIKKYRLKASSSCPDLFKNSMITIIDKEEKWYDDCMNCLSDMFNVELFKRATFNLLCLGTIILFIWFIVPYFYLAEHMVLNGYEEDDGAVMLSLIGITNTIGMISLGWIGDMPNVNIATLYGQCLVLCGATVASIPVASSSYWLLATASSAFGLLFAASFTFTPSLLVKIVSLDDFTSAYGLVLLAMGIGHLIGPPLSGLIFDITLSWELSFYLAGGWITVAGLLIWAIQPVTLIQNRRKNRSLPSDSQA